MSTYARVNQGVYIYVPLTTKIGCVSNELPTYLREGRAISFSNLKLQVESGEKMPEFHTYRLV